MRLFHSQLLLLCIAVATWARAQVDPGDMVIGSTAPGGGALTIAYDFSTPVRTTWAGALGTHSTYSANDPGFDEAGASDPLAGIHPLRPGTDVEVVLVSAEAGTALKVRDTLLARTGDTALLGTARSSTADLHHHPEFQLVLARPDGDFGEGHLGFRLRSPQRRYAPSKVHRLLVSNGYLDPVAFRTHAYDGPALRCRSALQRSTWRFLAIAARTLRACPVDVQGCLGPLNAAACPLAEASRATILAARRDAVDAITARCGPTGSRDWDARQVTSHLGLGLCRVESFVGAAHRAPDLRCAGAMAGATWTLARAMGTQLGRCLLRVQAASARASAGLPVAEGLVEQACAHERGVGPDGETLLGRIAAARARALASIRRRCGPVGAAALLRTVACGVEQMTSAAFPSAKDDLATYRSRRSQGGRPLSDHFPCLRGGHAHTHTHG